MYWVKCLVRLRADADWHMRGAAWGVKGRGPGKEEVGFL